MLLRSLSGQGSTIEDIFCDIMAERNVILSLLKRDTGQYIEKNCNKIRL